MERRAWDPAIRMVAETPRRKVIGPIKLEKHDTARLWLCQGYSRARRLGSMLGRLDAREGAVDIQQLKCEDDEASACLPVGACE